MILDKIENLKQYASLHPAIPQLIEFLETTNLNELPIGRLNLEKEDLYLNIDQSPAKKQEEALLEAHREYIDIQIPLSTSEKVGYTPLQNCKKIHTPYQAEKDYLFFEDNFQHLFTVHPGEFTLFLPNDAHAPAISTSGIKKVVAKLRINKHKKDR